MDDDNDSSFSTCSGGDRSKPRTGTCQQAGLQFSSTFKEGRHSDHQTQAPDEDYGNLLSDAFYYFTSPFADADEQKIKQTLKQVHKHAGSTTEPNNDDDESTIAPSEYSRPPLQCCCHHHDHRRPQEHLPYRNDVERQDDNYVPLERSVDEPKEPTCPTFTMAIFFILTLVVVVLWIASGTSDSDDVDRF